MELDKKFWVMTAAVAALWVTLVVILCLVVMMLSAGTLLEVFMTLFTLAAFVGIPASYVAYVTYLHDKAEKENRSGRR